VRSVNIGDVEVKVNFWDLSGHPEFFDVRNEFYRDAQGAMLVYDVSSRRSFEALDGWLKVGEGRWWRWRDCAPWQSRVLRACMHVRSRPADSPTERPADLPTTHPNTRRKRPNTELRTSRWSCARTRRESCSLPFHQLAPIATARPVH
jgi:hypothetical protein